MGIYGSVPSLLPADVASIKEGVFKGVYNKPALSQFHGVRTGIKGQTRIPIMGLFDGLLGSIKSDCDVTADSGTISVSEKTWTPKYVSGRIEMCYEDLMGTFWQWMSANGLSKENFGNTEFGLYAQEILKDALYEMVLRLGWFGDTALVAGTNNSISAGNAKYFTPINGLWKQLVAIAVADTTKRVTIARNTQVTDVLQRFTSAETTAGIVTGYFTDAHRYADQRLKDRKPSEKIIVCTDSIAEQYKAERKVASGIDLAYNRVENGIDTLNFDGIEVVPFAFLDRMIKAYYRDATNAYSINPHRFILTTKGAMANLLIGTEETSNLSELEADYSKRDKVWYADYGTMIDAKVANDDAVMVGY